MPPFLFCPQCSERLPPGSGSRLARQECPSCRSVHYRNAKPCAGALVVRDGQVLLGRRARDPFKDWWDLPGGFLEPWEEPAEAAVREVAEETGLVVRPTELLGIFIDTYGQDDEYTLNLHYLAEVVEGELRPGDDLVELAWFEPSGLPNEVAFANGRQALALWQQRMGHGGGR